MSESKNYVVATIRPWHLNEFHSQKNSLAGNWHLISDPQELTFENLSVLNPRYVFFPHWSKKVPNEIIEAFECVCFHETDVPFGRGGSPLQNLIVRGILETKITALRMVEQLDAGPVYLKRPFNLHGSAEEIFIRSAKICLEMMREIIENEPVASPQSGEAVYFPRRTPQQSIIPPDISTLEQMFDFIRMLDADEYPRAKILFNSFEMEFSRVALRVGEIEATVKIKTLEK